ncbi:MAG: hypothetical protein LBU79_03765 [Planctomycetota bacterium]|jgi:hypothetical protein|nr:hypothetical protein [Planctomycetota bacterium]
MGDAKKTVADMSVEELAALIKQKRKAINRESRMIETLKRRRDRLADKLARVDAAIAGIEDGSLDSGGAKNLLTRKRAPRQAPHAGKKRRSTK